MLLLRTLSCLVLCLLAACSSPGHPFFGVAPVRHEIAGRAYDVYWDARARDVQVIRMGYARRAEHPAILRAMVEAAQVVTGCRVDPARLQGDSGVMTARMRCDGG